MSKFYTRVKDIVTQKICPSTFINLTSKYYTIGKKEKLVIRQQEVVK